MFAYCLQKFRQSEGTDTLRIISKVALSAIACVKNFLSIFTREYDIDILTCNRGVIYI